MIKVILNDSDIQFKSSVCELATKMKHLDGGSKQNADPCLRNTMNKQGTQHNYI